MIIFLLLISLLLNGIAIFSIIILFTRQNRLLEVERNQEKTMKEMEEIFSTYLFEMKEENEAFIQKFKQAGSSSFSEINTNINHPKSLQQNKNVDDNVTKQDHEFTHSERIDKPGSALKKQAIMVYQAVKTNNEQMMEPTQKDVNDIKDMEAAFEQPEKSSQNSDFTHEEIYRDLFKKQVLILQKQGFSVDEIAKKLEKGKTEIELLLKLG